MQTGARVTTQSGVEYLKKLCRHFAHKVPTTLSGDQGIIDFPFGRCRIDATPDLIAFVIDIEEEREVSSAERVVTDQLQRVARREELSVQWVRCKL